MLGAAVLDGGAGAVSDTTSSCAALAGPFSRAANFTVVVVGVVNAIVIEPLPVTTELTSRATQTLLAYGPEDAAIAALTAGAELCVSVASDHPFSVVACASMPTFELAVARMRSVACVTLPGTFTLNRRNVCWSGVESAFRSTLVP